MKTSLCSKKATTLCKFSSAFQILQKSFKFMINMRNVLLGYATSTAKHSTPKSDLLLFLEISHLFISKKKKIFNFKVKYKQ